MIGRGWILAVLVGSLVLGGCGGDGGDVGDDVAASPQSPANGTGESTPATGGSTSTGSPTAAGGPVEQMSFACSPVWGLIPLEVAMVEGFMADAGVEIDCVQILSGPELSAAMLAEEVMSGPMTPTNLYPLLDGGEDFVMAGTFTDVENFDIVVREGFETPTASQGWEGVMSDLEGGRIGVVARGGAAEHIARALYAEAGLDPESATYIATGLAETTLPAMENNTIDAAIMIEPGVTQATMSGVGYQPFSIQEGDVEFMDWAAMGLASTRDLVTANSEAFCGFTTGLDEALAFVQDPASTDRTVAIIEDYLSLDTETAAALLERIRPFFPETSAVQADRFDPHFAFYAERGEADKAHTIEEIGLNPCDVSS